MGQIQAAKANVDEEEQGNQPKWSRKQRKQGPRAAQGGGGGLGERHQGEWGHLRGIQQGRGEHAGRPEVRGGVRPQ
eukprot:7168658-Pyramimonas_sp.AAC.1